MVVFLGLRYEFVLDILTIIGSVIDFVIFKYIRCLKNDNNLRL